MGAAAATFPPIPPSLLAGAAAAFTALVLAGLAYVFQPAWAAHRARRVVTPQYTYPVFDGQRGKKGGKGGGEKGEGAAVAAFPTLEAAPALTLSLVVPAYNEEARLPIMLDETLAYLEAWRTRDG